MRQFRSMVFLFALAIGTLSLVTAEPCLAEYRLGIQGGMNSSSFSGDTPPDIKYTTRSGLMIGAVGDFRLSEDAWLSLQPMYQQRGSGSEVQVDSKKDPVPGSSFEVDYFTLPILVRIFANNNKVYALGGFNVGFLTKAELVDLEGSRVDVDPYMINVDLAMDFGFGVMFPVKRSLINVEIRYEQGLLNLVDNKKDSEEVGAPNRLRQSGFQFIAGVQWPLGGK